jgi:chemotaxis signal transduction protein
MDHEQSLRGALKRGLECRIGKAPVAVPTDAVAQIVDYDVASPSPLASPWIGGIGVHAGRVVVSVSLGPSRRGALPRRRRTRGIVLNTPQSRAGFAIEVSQVLSLVDLEIADLPPAAGELGLPLWLREGRTASGQKLGWIDVNAMVREFDAVLGS